MFFFRPLLLILAFCLSLHGVYSQTAQADSIQFIQYGSTKEEAYSLYLPEKFSAGRNYPLLIFLDPAGRGDLPVRRYSIVREFFDVIMVGSYGSRNFDPTGSARSIAAIYDDLRSKYNIDSAKVWLIGFSGAARMATTFADTFSEIKGVVAMGAGFSQVSGQEKLLKYPFAGMVGIKDMNYEEMIGISEDLTKYGNENILLFDQLGHEWATDASFLNIMCWLTKDCPAMITQVARNGLKYIGERLDDGLLYHHWIYAREMKKITPLFLSADSLQRAIESHKEFTHDKKEFLEMLRDERNYLDEFTIAFNKTVFQNESSFDKAIWIQKNDMLRENLRSKKNYDTFSATRRQDFSRRLCMEQFQYLLSNQQYKQAYTSARVLEIFDTGFPMGPQVFLARASAGLKDSKLTIKHLKAGIRAGRVSRLFVMQDPLLREFIGSEALEKLFVDEGK